MSSVSRGRGTNSVGYLQELAASCLVAVPDYVQLKPGAELLWPEFAAARAPNQWGGHDLILIAKICNWEVDIRKNQDLLDRTGPIVKTKRGTPIANPIASVITKLQRQQLAVLRMLSFGVPNEGSSARARANQSRSYRALSQALDDDEQGLLARPNDNY